MEFFFPFFDFIGVPILFLVFVFLFFIESKYQLRKRKVSRRKRAWRNIGLAFISLIFLRWLLVPVMVWIASWAQSKDIGLINWLRMNAWMEFYYRLLIARLWELYLALT